jgi:hypothetical protein
MSPARLPSGNGRGNPMHALPHDRVGRVLTCSGAIQAPLDRVDRAGEPQALLAPA